MSKEISMNEKQRIAFENFMKTLEPEIPEDDKDPVAKAIDELSNLVNISYRNILSVLHRIEEFLQGTHLILKNSCEKIHESAGFIGGHNNVIERKLDKITEEVVSLTEVSKEYRTYSVRNLKEIMCIMINCNKKLDAIEQKLEKRAVNTNNTNVRITDEKDNVLSLESLKQLVREIRKNRKLFNITQGEHAKYMGIKGHDLSYLETDTRLCHEDRLINAYKALDRLIKEKRKGE